MEQSRETYINAVGREIPKQIGNYVVKPYTGAYTTVPSDAPVHTLRTAGKHVSGDCKMAENLKDAIVKTGLKDGMTISFHHSFREGDEIIGQVLTAIRELGTRDSASHRVPLSTLRIRPSWTL